MFSSNSFSKTFADDFRKLWQRDAGNSSFVSCWCLLWVHGFFFREQLRDRFHSHHFPPWLLLARGQLAEMDATIGIRWISNAKLQAVSRRLCPPCGALVATKPLLGGSSHDSVPDWVAVRAAKGRPAGARGRGQRARGGRREAAGVGHQRRTGWAPSVTAAAPPAMRGIVVACSCCEHPLCRDEVMTLTDLVRPSHVACTCGRSILVWLLLSSCRVRLLPFFFVAPEVLGGRGGQGDAADSK